MISILNIFNVSLQRAIFPNDWKQAKVLKKEESRLRNATGQYLLFQLRPNFSENKIETKLNKDIENVNRWLTANKLSLNMKKTEFMIIGSKNLLTKIKNSPVLTLRENNIKRIFQKRSLGMILNDQLK